MESNNGHVERITAALSERDNEDLAFAFHSIFRKATRAFKNPCPHIEALCSPGHIFEPLYNLSRGPPCPDPSAESAEPP